MGTITARESGRVAADPALVLEILRDFGGQHLRILPPAFSDVRVIEGGVGAGTRMGYTVTIGGRAVPTTSVADEPEPGVLRETIEGSDLVTLFRVTPDEAGSTVEISSTWTPAGLAERLVAPRLLRGIYRDELRLLDEVARELAAQRGAATATGS